MAKKLTEKYNDSCIKIFEFIKMLYNDNADFKKVINLFSNGNYDGTSNTHVTLNKYLNTLKLSGIKIKKINHKYKMYSALTKINLNSQDLKSVAIIKEASALLPEGNNKKNIEKFINDLELRYDDLTKSLVAVSHNTNNLNLDFYNSEILEQVKTCEKYCQDQLKLEIIFNNEDSSCVNLLCTPLEVVYLKRKICLKCIGSNGNRIYQIPIENIISIKQLPAVSNPMAMPTTIVFRIKNRLAKNYKLRDWERLENTESDGSKIIINKNEDLNILLKRLMRYNTECEIISPKFFKEEMINRINKTLSNYQ